MTRSASSSAASSTMPSAARHPMRTTVRRSTPAGANSSTRWSSRRACRARRLLQRVLEFAPAGVERGPWCASDGARPKKSWSWPREKADLVIFGWGGRPSGRHGRPPTSQSSAPPSTRSCATRPATSQSSSSGASRTSSASSCLCAVATCRAGTAVRGRARSRLRCRGVCAPRGRRGPDPTLHSQAERALAMFVRQHAGEAPRPVVASGTDVGADHARGSRRRPRGHGRQRRGRRRGLAVRRAAGGGRTGRRPDRHRGADPRDADTFHFEQRAEQAETLEAAERAASTGRACPPGRSLVRRIELPSPGVRRPQTSRGAQGEAGADHLGGAAHAQ